MAGEEKRATSCPLWSTEAAQHNGGLQLQSSQEPCETLYSRKYLTRSAALRTVTLGARLLAAN